MQFGLTLATALAVLQFVNADDTVYITRLRTTTVPFGYTQVSTQVATELLDDSTVSPQAAASTETTAPAAQTTPSPSPSPSPTTEASAPAPAPASPSPSPSPSSSSSLSGIYADISLSPGLDQSFAKSILDGHNTDRAAHQAPPLSWDQTVYNYAQAYADKYDCSGQLVHSGGQYGENLAVGFSDGTAALQAWYSEGNNYDYSNTNQYTHFTQVIWKSTTKLGCAIKDCTAQNWGHYVICSYDPAGNMVGEEAANVLQ